MKEILGIIIPLICSLLIAIVFFVVIKKKLLAICVSIAITLLTCIVIVGVFKWYSDQEKIIKNEYVEVNTKGLDCTDYSNSGYPCFLELCDKSATTNDYVYIYITELALEEYQEIISKQDFFDGYGVGYCAGTIAREYDVEVKREDVRQVLGEGVYINETFMNYRNVFVCEKRVNDKDVLLVCKILYIGDGQMLLAMLHMENVDYDFYKNSKSQRMKIYRECFNSIKQRVI